MTETPMMSFVVPTMEERDRLHSEAARVGETTSEYIRRAIARRFQQDGVDAPLKLWNAMGPGNRRVYIGDEPIASSEGITTVQLSALLGIPVSTLRYWRRGSRGPRWRRLGRRYLYSRSDVEEWLATREAGGEQT